MKEQTPLPAKFGEGLGLDNQGFEISVSFPRSFVKQGHRKLGSCIGGRDCLSLSLVLDKVVNFD
jgi:hypothetical protein